MSAVGAVGELALSATSGRSPVKKVVSPTTGSKVQQSLLGDRSWGRNLRSGHSSPSDAIRRQGSTVCVLVRGLNWRCRPVADADHLPKRTLGISDLDQAFAALAG
jgi:hypothetical protein